MKEPPAKANLFPGRLERSAAHPVWAALGLLSVRDGAFEHGGTVEVTESDLGGACFTVSIPVGDVSAREAV